MKNVPIKFRGLAIKDYNFKPLEKKRLVYGNVWLNEDNSFALIGEYRSKKDGRCYNYEVEPDSICQLVGYDANGKEVYENDILTNPESLNGIKAGSEWTACIGFSAELDIGDVYDCSFDKMILKEK